MHAIQFTMRSSNSKVGPVPVSTTSRETCPDACPLKANGCYAELGPLGMMWTALSKAKPGKTFNRGRNTLHALTWAQFCKAVARLPEDKFWRHNQAGDLPGQGDAIDRAALSELVQANIGRRGFTYTHKPLNSANSLAIAYANAEGFTINLSANTLSHADELAAADVGPVVVVLPADVDGSLTPTLETPAGRKVAVCPATYRDEVSCVTCQLCQHQNRKVIVG